jgi:hypothetical protein
MQQARARECFVDLPPATGGRADHRLRVDEDRVRRERGMDVVQGVHDALEWNASHDQPLARVKGAHARRPGGGERGQPSLAAADFEYPLALERDQLGIAAASTPSPSRRCMR